MGYGMMGNLKGPSMKPKVRGVNLKRPGFGFTPESYADISSSTFGQLASGNSPKFGLTPESYAPFGELGSGNSGNLGKTDLSTQSTDLSSRSFDPGPDIPGDDIPYTWEEFGNPMSMLQLALAAQLGQAGTIGQESDLHNRWLEAYEDIDRSSIIGERNIRDTLNQRNVWNSGIKEREVGELAADKLKYLGRADLAQESGKRDINLARKGYDLQYDLGSLMEGSRTSLDPKGASNKVRSDMADRIRAMSN